MQVDTSGPGTNAGSVLPTCTLAQLNAMPSPELQVSHLEQSLPPIVTEHDANSVERRGLTVRHNSRNAPKLPVSMGGPLSKLKHPLILVASVTAGTSPNLICPAKSPPPCTQYKLGGTRHCDACIEHSKSPVPTCSPVLAMSQEQSSKRPSCVKAFWHKRFHSTAESSRWRTN
jgi:hypothetical protein